MNLRIAVVDDNPDILNKTHLGPGDRVRRRSVGHRWQVGSGEYRSAVQMSSS